MRILQVVQDFPPHNMAGVEVYTCNLSKKLSEKHSISIFHRVNELKQEEYEVNSYKFEDLDIFTINNTFKYCYSFKDFYCNDDVAREFGIALDKVSPDIVHIQHLIFLSVTLIKEIKIRNIPIVFTLHDYWLICPQWHFLKKDLSRCNIDDIKECINCLDYQLKIRQGPKKLYNAFRSLIPKYLTYLLRKVYVFTTKPTFNTNKAMQDIKDRAALIRNLLKDVDLFISPSRFLKGKFVEFGIPLDKIKISSYGINDRLFKNIQKKDSSIIRFGFIGTILPAKGLHVAIEAFNKLKSNASFKVYGKLYPYRGFEWYPGYIKKITKSKNIKFMQDFNNEDIAKVFSEIDVLIVPSIWYENSPLTIQEAFLSKTPVIASRIGGIPELIKDGENGLLFKVADSNELLGKIKLMLNESHMLEKLKAGILKPRSIDENSKELDKIYSNLIDKTIKINV